MAVTVLLVVAAYPPMTERADDQDGGGDGGREAGPAPSQIDTRYHGDELVVVADLPLTDPEDLRAGIDGDGTDLVITTNRRTVGRVVLPWESTETTRARFHNGVLELRLRPAVDPASD